MRCFHFIRTRGSSSRTPSSCPDRLLQHGIADKCEGRGRPKEPRCQALRLTSAALLREAPIGSCNSDRGTRKRPSLGSIFPFSDNFFENRFFGCGGKLGMEGLGVSPMREAVSNEGIAVCDLSADIECAGAPLQKLNYLLLDPVAKTPKWRNEIDLVGIGAGLWSPPGAAQTAYLNASLLDWSGYCSCFVLIGQGLCSGDRPAPGVAQRDRPELIEKTYGFRPTMMISVEQVEYTEPALLTRSASTWFVPWIGSSITLDGDLVFLASREVPAILHATATSGPTTRTFSGCRRTSYALTFLYEWKKLPGSEHPSSSLQRAPPHSRSGTARPETLRDGRMVEPPAIRAKIVPSRDHGQTLFG